MAVPVVQEIGNTKLDSGWFAAKSEDVKLDGFELTNTDHRPSIGQSPWMVAVVPGTVLGTLVMNKAVADPFYGLENKNIIDIASGKEYYTYWFFTTFTCNLVKQYHHVDLNFRGINYSAELYINGKYKTELGKGMFRRHRVDVTNMLNLNGENFLALLVHPPDHPGKIPEEGGQGGDHEIGKDVAAQFVEGWDWIISIADRNTGIWDEVSICVTGPVKIMDAHLASILDENYMDASFYATVELKNTSASEMKCLLSMDMELDFEDMVYVIPPIPSQDVVISAALAPPKPTPSFPFPFPEVILEKPELWWPNGTGPNPMRKQQPLYKVTISVHVEGVKSDSWSHLFGFREIKSHVDQPTRARLFQVNGEDVFIRGGNWTISDGLLRLSTARYQTEMKYHADMNLNMIRCWGGGLGERPDFYHYCDLYGLLVWQEFWITGDVDGRGVPFSNPNGPLDHDLFMVSVRDTVKLLRNHPSLAIWVGGNEQVPAKDLNKRLMEELIVAPPGENPSKYLDGTRLYIRGSLWEGFADSDGGFSDGPYTIQDPISFFEEKFYSYGFNPEVGSVGMPVAATIRATMPFEGWTIPKFEDCPGGYVREVPNPIWDYHKYHPYSNPDAEIHNQISLYGKPTNLDDFCLQAQLANYIQYRALLEGWNSRMWTKYTGVLIWKTQNPWTGLRGQFYDHLLDQTGGFYGCRSAAEPIHVQLNLETYLIEVVNTTAETLHKVAIEVSVWDLEGKCPYNKLIEFESLPPKETTKLTKHEMTYPKHRNAKQVYFLLLKLYDKQTQQPSWKIKSRNFYWLHLENRDYKPLKQYRTQIRIPLKITSKLVIKGSLYEIEMHIQNLSHKKPLRSYEGGRNEKDIRHLARCEEKGEKNVFKKMLSYFSTENELTKVTNIDGNGVGVAFFLQFSVHNYSNKSHQEEDEVDTRILPVHYSDNYFSLVPDEDMHINISFDVPDGINPAVKLTGWNCNTVDIAI